MKPRLLGLNRRERKARDLLMAETDLTLWMTRHLRTSQPEGREVNVEGRRYRLTWWPRLEPLTNDEVAPRRRKPMYEITNLVYPAHIKAALELLAVTDQGDPEMSEARAVAGQAITAYLPAPIVETGDRI